MPKKRMIKLPISDYVADYYKNQGIELTPRQQATLCWFYHSLLKDQLKSLKDILSISDDEKLNTEIKERVEYEEKAYECFMTNNDPAVFYVFHSDDKDECDEYFASAKAAISYGKRHSNQKFNIDKCYLADRCPDVLINGKGVEESDPLLATYYFTSGGDVRYGNFYQDKAPFEQDCSSRFEDMFLNIKSPFGLGDIVMGPDWDYPQVVSTDHDCFEETYARFRNNKLGIVLDIADNCIRTDYFGKDGSPYYAHTIPFDLWKIDSWEDEEYWEILQILSRSVKAGIDLFNLDYHIYEYKKANEGKK